MRAATSSILIGLVFLASACGKDAKDDAREYLEGTPDLEALTLEVSGDPAEGASLIAPLPGPRTHVTGHPPEWLGTVRVHLKQLNDAVRKVMEPLQTLVAGQAVSGEGFKIYGPTDIGAVTFRLDVRRLAPRRFGWRLMAKALGADDATYRRVMAGRMTRGLLPHRGHGVMGVDLDLYRQADPSYTGEGKLFVAFGHGAAGHKVLIYSLQAFQPANVAWEYPITAHFAGHRLPSGERRVRTFSFTDLVAGPNGDELVFSRARWIPGVGGRAAILMPTEDGVGANGDVPALKYRIGWSCWNAAEEEQYRALLDCDQGSIACLPGGTCTACSYVSGFPQGDAAACASALPQEAPPLDPTDTTPEQDPGETPDALPTAMPEDF